MANAHTTRKGTTMSESFQPDPIDMNTQRIMVTVELHVTGRLIPYLDVAGLQLVRNSLRSEDSRRMCATGNLAVVRADVLEAVCRRLDFLGFAPLAYFQDVFVADMRPDTPDDISELEES